LQIREKLRYALYLIEYCPFVVSHRKAAWVGAGEVADVRALQVNVGLFFEGGTPKGGFATLARIKLQSISFCGYRANGSPQQTGRSPGVFAEAKVVIELDGPHHLHDPEAYRRDRRKDLMLQEQGYFVVRFLAEDVGKYLDHVLDTVLRVPASYNRRKKTRSAG
jgi:hypothetical protein